MGYSNEEQFIENFYGVCIFITNDFFKYGPPSHNIRGEMWVFNMQLIIISNL